VGSVTPRTTVWYRTAFKNYRATLADGPHADNLILKVFGKGQKERLVPFSPELRKRLYRFEQLKLKKGIRSDFVFAGFRGRWEKRNSILSRLG
jgi:site-specific recombinase XerD